MKDKRLFLLDAFALIYRAYFAFAKVPMVNSKGVNTSAIFGFLSTLLDLIEKEKPTHLAVVFDMAGPTDRAVEFEFYKANREEMPEDIRNSIPYIHRILDAFNIPTLGLEGYEADDIIGTLAKQKSKEDHVVYMVTPDKDFCQLVEDKIFVYKPGRQGNSFEILGVKEVCEKWEVENPLQVIDILGLWGDSVDNIPGIPSVGEKTAKKLIQEYKSVEGVIKNAASIKGKLGENISQFAQQGLDSKKLATIITDAPVHVSDESLEISTPDKEKLTEIFVELEFRTIGRRVFGEAFTVNQPIAKQKSESSSQGSLFEEVAEVNETGLSILNSEHSYSIASDRESRQKLIQLLLTQKVICFDTESTGLDSLQSEIVGLSFSCVEHEAYYVPLPMDREEKKSILHEFTPVFSSNSIIKIGQNVKFDLKLLSQYQIELAEPIADTMIQHYVLEPDLRHNMNYLSETYLGYTPIPIENLIGKKGKGQLNMADIALDKIAEYAAEDADITLRLYNVFKEKTKEKEVDDLLQNIEYPLVKILADIELEGVNIDADFLNQYSKSLGEEMELLKVSIYETAGNSFNLDSPKQLGEILFDKLKIPYTEKKTSTGQYSTNEEVLSKLAKDHEIASRILDYRELTKLKSTYVDALPLMINHKTGRLHTTYNQTIAATGRLSSVNPNLQNIPIKTDRGKEIRKAFIPRNEEYKLLSADYSQIELRLVAAISNEEAMIADFEQGLDIHAATAAKVYNIDLDEVTRTMRSNAKMVNFGIIYAISAFGLSQRLSIPRKEAAELINNYFIKYPKIREYMDNTLEFARKSGYVKTIMGRRRYLKDINSANFTVRAQAEREAINAPIQGSAADLIKIAMINIHREIKSRNMKSSMILQVHDELVFDAHENEIEDLKILVVDKMQNAIQLNVPIIAEVGVGLNWLQAH